MAKFGLQGRLFRTCSERDNLRAPRTPTGYPARNKAAVLSFLGLNPLRRTVTAAMLGIGILLPSLCASSLQAHAAETKWWALGTFIQPLSDTSKQTELEMQANASAWAAFQSGKTAAEAGNHKDAVDSFARAIKLYGPNSPLTAKIYAKQAQSLLSVGKHLDAIGTLNALIALKPERPEGYWTRARIHWDARDYDKALSDYETVARLSPNLVGAHMNRGLALYNLRRADQALSAFEDAIAAAKKRYVAIAVYWNSSHYAKSTPDFVNTMLSLLDHDRDMTLAKAHVWLGQTHFRRSRFWAALRAYEKAIKIAPDYVLAYKYRGWLNEKMGHIPEARADYRTAANLVHADPWTLKALRRVR
jgi:tetratricopeptide (TPR) repeat protein